MDLRSRRLWFWLLIVCTAIGLLNFGHFFLDDLARRHYGTGLRRFIEEMTGAYTALVLVPLVVAASQRFQWSRRTWVKAVLANIAGLIAYSLLHTTLIAFLRAAIFPLSGLGAYDYGIMLYRYPMEAATDAIFYALAACAAYLASHFAAAREAQLAAVRLQAELAQAQLENLRLQLHPHFLFNTLNAVSAVMYEDVRKADAMLMKLSDFLRDVLAFGSVQQVPLEQELRVARAYVEIMTARLEKQLSLQIRLAEESRTAQVPFMLLQPLLENSIRHGTNAHPDHLNIEIVVEREGDAIVLQVLDDGSGIANGRPHRGHGLRNVAARLEHLYPGQAQFDVGPRAGGGTRAMLRFPLRLSEAVR